MELRVFQTLAILEVNPHIFCVLPIIFIHPFKFFQFTVGFDFVAIELFGNTRLAINESENLFKLYNFD